MSQRPFLPALALAALAAGCASSHPTTAPAPAAAPAGAVLGPVAWPDESPIVKLAPRPTTPAITAADLMTRLYRFADDSMQGREAGALGNYKGTDYIAGEFARDGLQPMGEHGTFFQTIGLVRGGFDSTLSLTSSAGAVTPWQDVVPLPPIGQTPFVPQWDGHDVPVVFAGRWGDSTATPAGALDGKVAVFLLPGDGRSLGFWVVPDPRAAKASAVAVVAPDSLMPLLAGNFDRERESLQREHAAAGPLASFISGTAAARLLGRPLDGLAPGTAGATLSGSVHYVERPTAYPARNVIALLKGSDPARNGEYVVVSAHNDHVGMGRVVDHDSLRAFNRVMRPWGANNRVGDPTPAQWDSIRTLLDSARARRHGAMRPDSIFNGADDDGSGTVVLLEIAEDLAHRPTRPARSILFVSHTGEEKGLLGSQWFTDHPTVPRDSIVAALNMDMLGKGRKTDMDGSPTSVQLIGSFRLSTDLGKLIDSLNAHRSEHMAIDYTYDAHGNPLNRYCRSDHFMYARYGIPITYVSLGYAIDYHQQTDEPQYIDYDHGALVGRFVRDIALAVADRPDRLKVDGPIQDPNKPCRQ
jgi:hypothetical protein